MEAQNTLYTPQQAADYVGVNYRTILSWISSGELECYRIGDGRSIRIDQNQINDYLASHKSSKEQNEG